MSIRFIQIGFDNHWNTQMSVRGMSWYLSGVLGLSWLLTFVITYAPGAGRLGFIITGSGAIITAAWALYLGRLPLDHWARHSTPLWWTTACVAGITTLFAMMLIG